MTRACERGFSLLEILTAIAIVTILAAIAIPHFRDTRARSLDASLASMVRHVATGEEAYYAIRQRYTPSVDDLDGIIVVGGTTITIDHGNSGDIDSSFRVRGEAPGAPHAYVWLSDPAPGESNLIAD